MGPAFAGEVGETCSPCQKKKKKKVKPKLVRVTVIRHATQESVVGKKNWATVKKASDDVIVEATTSPHDEATWKKLKWSGGEAVPGHPNRRKVSRAKSKKHKVKAKLGGKSDHVVIWVLWAFVHIKVSGKTPPNSLQFAALNLGSEDLGAVADPTFTEARGKVAPLALLTPKGVHKVVPTGWGFRRALKSHVWYEGVKQPTTGQFTNWTVDWSDDTSESTVTRLTPDEKDLIYDLDAPSIGPFAKDVEIYVNFRQWIEWQSGDLAPPPPKAPKPPAKPSTTAGWEICSEYANWYWQARYQQTAQPAITFAAVGVGHQPLPVSSHFHPGAAPKK